MMEAVLSNADHPEYGVATIPLPIPRNQYDHCVALLEALEIGDASEADCRVDSLDSAWPVLNRLVSTKVNLDERWTIWPSGWTALLWASFRNFRRWLKNCISPA